MNNLCPVCDHVLNDAPIQEGYSFGFHKCAIIKTVECPNYNFSKYHEYRAIYDMKNDNAKIEYVFLKTYDKNIFITLNYQDKSTSISFDRRSSPTIINSLMSLNYKDVDEVIEKINKYILFY